MTLGAEATVSSGAPVSWREQDADRGGDVDDGPALVGEPAGFGIDGVDRDGPQQPAARLEPHRQVLDTHELRAVTGGWDAHDASGVAWRCRGLLGILGLTSLVAPDGVAVAQAALFFDVPVMLAVAIACLPIFFTGHCIARWEGAVFVAYYAAYTAYLLMAASRHAALEDFRFGMVYVVIPMTAITLVALAIDSLKARRHASQRKDTPQ
jgi:hypothetical protein